MSITDVYERIRFRGRPRPNREAVVVRGKARFTVLTPRLLRLEWSERREFEDRSTYAFPSRYTEVAPTFEVTEEDGWVRLDTGALELRYAQERGPFAPDSLTIAYELNDEVHVWRPGTPDVNNLKGTRRTLDRCAGDASLEPGLISRAGWALFDDTKNVIYDDEGWVGPRPDAALQDWYFFGYGHDYVGALRDYRVFGGESPLIPRFVLGAWWSRYWAYSEQDLRDLVGQFEEHNVPLDVLVIDMDWHTPHAWTGYTWNRSLFPDPPAFLQWVHDKGLRVTLNLHPAQGVQAFEDAYPAFARALGANHAAGDPVPFRIADKQFVKHYFELLHHPMEDEGVDFWWMDWQQGEISEVKGLDPLPWINHLHFSDSRRRGVRPMLYSRWGGSGNHRYYVGFSGDTYVTWESLQFQPYMTATASNVLYGWWSHDIGGHMGGATEPELYARWVQFGALSPVLRLHSTKDPRGERRPWAFPERVFKAARAAFRLRYQLVPYLYTMARTATDTGLSLCRPMYYEHPETADAYAARYQYRLGDQMIAAPIVFPADPATGLAVTDVWLPEGTWIAYDTLETFSGDRWVRMLGDLDRIPLLVKAGGVVPVAGRFQRRPPPALTSGTTDAQPQDRLVLEVFPGEGALRVYRDDGVTENYRAGKCEWVPVRTSQADDGSAWNVTVGPVEGHCDSLPDLLGYEVRMVGSHAPERVLVDGESATYRYDASRATTIVPLGMAPKGASVVISACRSGGIVALGAARNEALAAVDLARLFGKETWDGKANLDTVEARAREAASDVAYLNAVARAGGPFFRVMEFVTPDEASQQLGRVVIAGPADGSTMDIVVEFTLEREGQYRTHRVARKGIAGSAVIDTPFAFDGSVARQVWHADVRLEWGGHTISGSYASRALFPGIYRWHARLYDGAVEAVDVQGVTTATAGATYPPQYSEFVHDPAQTRNLNEALVLRFWEQAADRFSTFGSPAAYVVTSVECPSDRDAVLELAATDGCEVHVNSVPAELLDDQACPDAHILFRPPRRTVPVRLHKGKNSLVIHTCPPPDEPHAWYLGARFLTPDGVDIGDLTFG